ncbi:MAG: PQQ-dependent sugar dehydrogenase [Cyanobacteriota bacterium]|nr:PQQ-dependent sugar dehydrogenase [Cyanobacteriota bacterium]
MKKSSLIKKSTFPYWICSVFFAVIAFASISSAQIAKNPIPELIEKSKLSVGLEEVVKIPDSGSDKDENKAARLNLLIPPGDGSGRLFVNDMRGKLYVISDRTTTVYMDVKSLVGKGFHDQSGQQGFSYFAFHPEFAKNGIFYTVTSEDKDAGTPDFPVTQPIFNNKGQRIESSHHDVIREWKATNPSANTFSGTRREILLIEEPYPDHNTGQLAFNPNAKPGDADYGMLYIALADGGSNGFPVSDTDPLDNGQDLGTPLGKILRIEPFGNNSANGKYGIPADNPFVDDGDPKTLGEIWAYGLRNPHRFSWDTGGDGKMLIVDTGQAFIEEVNLGKKGANYGWGEREGTWVIDENNENIIYELPDNDRDFNYTYPVAQYDHEIPPGVKDFYGIAIAGGFVYRGTAIPELVGQYVFADFGSDGRFFHVPVDELTDGAQATIKELRLFEGNQERSFLKIVGHNRTDVRFGIDETGELYVTSKQDGKVRKIVPSPESLNYQGKVQSEVSTAVGTIRPTLYDGRTAFRLSDGRTEAVVVPEIGRVMRYGFVDGSNFLWNSPRKTYGENEWKNWGGDKTWPAPQQWWPAIAERGWPPDPAWDGNAHRAQILPNNHLQMTSEVAKGFGARVVREFWFERNGDFIIQQTVEKVKGEPLLLSIWNVSQIEPPDAIFLPLNQESIYKNNFHWLVPPENESPIVHRTTTLLQVRPSLGVSAKKIYKVGADTSIVAVAAIKDGVAMIEKATRQDGEYPDGAVGGGGFPVEVYNNGDAKENYVELELLSPLHHLGQGDRYQHTVRWSLHQLLSSNVNAMTTRDAIEKLLKRK